MKRSISTRLACLAVTAALAAMASCSRNIIYSHYEAVSISGWANTDTLTFTTDSLDNSSGCQATLHVRYTDLYPYRQIALVVKQRVTPAGTSRTDTMTLELTDAEGHTNSQGSIHHDMAIDIPTLPMGKGDAMTVSVAHHMHQSLLPGITDVGIEVK